MKMKCSGCHERGTKKKSESPTGLEPVTSQTPGGRSIHFEPPRIHRERDNILGSYLTRVQRTGRISNVDVVLCGKRLKDGKF